MSDVIAPNFHLMMASVVIFALAILFFKGWRFGGPDAFTFAIVSGLFTASMDFISTFVVQHYKYPGQSQLWVFTFFFGWIGMCSSCLLIAEGILSQPGKDMLSHNYGGKHLS